MAIFRVFNGRELVGEFFFDQGPITVGRHPNSDICVPQDVVSRHHAVIKKTGQTWSVEKTTGRNGIFVNGKYSEFQILKPDDRIEVGHTIIQFSESGESRSAATRRDKHEPGAGYYRSMDEVMSLLGQADDVDDDDEVFSWDEPTRPLPQRKQVVEDDDDDDEISASSTVMLTVDQVAARHDQYETELHMHLSWHDEDGQRQIQAISSEPLILGRGRDARVPITGGLGIGNRFAIITSRPDGVFVDRCSRLVSVKVNGEPVKSPVQLRDNDTISIYETNVVFHQELFD